MTPVKISVLTAVRNGSGTIGQTIESVSRQTYPAKEHIIQDGKSVDDTLAVIQRHASPIVDWESSSDTGVYDAFNRALRRSRGDVICFLGGDDVYEGDEVLAEIADAFANPEVDMVFGDALVVSREEPSRVVRYYKSGRFTGIRSLRNGFMPAHTATFVRRRLYEHFGLFDPSYVIAGDFEWFVRACRDASPRYVYLQKPLVRMRAGGLSSGGLGATWKVTREFKRACRENEVSTNYVRLLLRLAVKGLELARRSQ